MTLTAASHPAEYERPAVYGRPPGGMVRTVERVLDGQTQTEALNTPAGSTSNG